MTAANPFAALTLDQLRTRTSIKWTQYGPDVLPLWVAEMDVPLAEPIADALVKAVREGDMGYPGSWKFREALASFAADSWGWEPAVADMRPIASVIVGYTDAILAATDVGSHVVVTSPVYPPFYTYLREAGREILEAPLTEDMRIDLDALASAFAAATAGGRSAAFLLCNPHNPGGTVHTREELEQVAELAARHGVQVVSDEIHAPIVYSDSTYVPYLTVDPRGVAVHAASKGWNLAAVPGAIVVFGPEAGELKRALMAGAHHWPTHLGTIAQTVAWNDCRDWLADVLRGLDENRRLLGELLAEHLPGARYHVPQATYLTWIDCRGLGLGDDPAAVFLTKGRVAFNSGPTFGTGGAGHVRLNIATSPAIIEEAVRRMASVL
ncbi:MAG: aminotransferase class I/II-fold pyridoxal phosphate-dependent enzyme [Actinomycetes bacterium]|nr:MAG: cystathionine beta-lyase [Actinomycetota bacterium]